MDFLNENLSNDLSISPSGNTLADGTTMYTFATPTGDTGVNFATNDSGYVKFILITGEDLGNNTVAGEEISNILDPNVDRGALSGDIIMKRSYCTDKLGVVTKEDENYVYTAILPRALYDKVDHCEVACWQSIRLIGGRNQTCGESRPGSCRCYFLMGLK